MERTNAQPHVVIVGGGISGLAAAFFLRDEAVRVTVLEGSPRLGGKLSVSEIGGVAVDEGAEALLVTRPEGIALIAEAGLGDQRAVPGPTSSAIWTLGALRPLPRRQFMGVPSDMTELAKSGVLSDEGVARASQDLELPLTARDGDVAVADYVGARLGDEVVDRLVDPLLGGVYAGRSAELSFDATLPALAAASRKHRSLVEAARSLLPPSAPASPGPAQAPGAARAPGTRAGGSVFTTLAGGLGMLPAYLAKASGAEVRTAAMARELAPAGSGWRLTVGSAAAPEQFDADAVILALPARPAGRLLADVPGVSAAVRAFEEINYASMAIVTLAYPRSAFPGPGLAALGWSGYLVPAVDGRVVKAATFSTVKWPHLAGGRHPVANPWRSSAVRSAGWGRKGCCSGSTVISPRWPRRTRGGDRGAGRACGHQGDPLGRRAAPVHGRAPGPGGHDTRGGGGSAWARRLRRGLRRGGHTRLCRDGARGGQPGDGIPRDQASDNNGTRAVR